MRIEDRLKVLKRIIFGESIDPKMISTSYIETAESNIRKLHVLLKASLRNREISKYSWQAFACILRITFAPHGKYTQSRQYYYDLDRPA